MEMKFCRRCGLELARAKANEYKCANDHTVYVNASATVTVALVDGDRRVAIGVRAAEPGVGMLGLIGGFCDPGESLEEALEREIKEEAGLRRADYSTPEYVGSMPHDYLMQGDNTPIVSALYRARIREGAELAAGDDVASIEMMLYEDIDLNRAYFETMTRIIEILRERGEI